MKIGISGVAGSFSEEAARLYANKEGIEPELEYLVSVEGVLSALEAGTIETGIFPIQNSIGGIVIEAVYAIAKHRFIAEKMFELEVHQNLLVMPGVKAEEISVISSHDQALKQCKGYIDRRFPDAERKEYPDTAKAAEDLASGILPRTTAVIASKTAAQIYGLEILDASIQDMKFNFTTFVVAKPFQG